MTQNIDIRNNEDVVKEIREKIKKNPKYINPCCREFQEDIKNYKFENGNKFISWMQENGILVNPTNVERKIKYRTIKNKGCNNQREYRDLLARDEGYKDYAEYWKEWNWNHGIKSPMSENKDCSYYLGVYIGEDIAEPILIEIFGSVEKRMLKPNYPGYEYVVKGGYKIDVKTATFNKKLNNWTFAIRHNNTADYFLLLAFDSENKDLLHVLLIEKNEIVRQGTGAFGYVMEKFYKRESFSMSSNPRSPLHLIYFKKKYEWTDKLKCLKECHDKLKDKIDH